MDGPKELKLTNIHKFECYKCDRKLRIGGEGKVNVIRCLYCGNVIYIDGDVVDVIEAECKACGQITTWIETTTGFVCTGCGSIMRK